MCQMDEKDLLVHIFFVDIELSHVPDQLRTAIPILLHAGLGRFLALYSPKDLRHPSALGTYLAACTIVSSITGPLSL